jgi:hypothetical protein
MKHYIVANKRQEFDVLCKLEDEGFMWVNSNKLPTEHTVSEFPHVIIADNNKNNTIMWSAREVDFERNVVYDGRKDEKMTEVKKYKVTKEFMDEIVAWRDKQRIDATRGYGFVYLDNLDKIPYVVKAWWLYDNTSMERNNRLIAIISWLNGDEVFEVEKPKFVVRSDKTDSYGDYTYVVVKGGTTATSYFLSNATKFSTREGAQEWANSHQVVIEVDAEG